MLVLSQTQSKRDAFGERWGSFVLFTYLGLALDRQWYKILLWHNCKVQLGSLYGWSYASICVSVMAYLLFDDYETPIYFSYIFLLYS